MKVGLSTRALHNLMQENRSRRRDDGQDGHNNPLQTLHTRWDANRRRSRPIERRYKINEEKPNSAITWNNINENHSFSWYNPLLWFNSDELNRDEFS